MSHEPIRVAELWRYPVKSMAGERLDTAELRVDGIPGDRALYVVDGDGEIVSARTRPLLLGHRATLTAGGEVLVDGRPWDSPAVAADVERAAGPGARIVAATGAERFDILPLLVVTDGAIAAFGHDRRRLRPNIVLAGVPGLAERTWPQRQMTIGTAVIVPARLRRRCIVTTYDPDTVAQDIGVLRGIGERFGGTLGLDSWAGTPGTVAVGDRVELRDERVPVAFPELGRFAA